MTDRTGMRGPDTLTGTNGDDRLEGLGGDDDPLGPKGADVLDGGTGSDQFDGGLDADIATDVSLADSIGAGDYDRHILGGQCPPSSA